MKYQLSNYNDKQEENTNAARKELPEEPDRQEHTAQLNESINSHKEEIKRIYSKYDKQKEFISVALMSLNLQSLLVQG